jgi:hypothetical protein
VESVNSLSTVHAEQRRMRLEKKKRRRKRS